MWGKGKGTDLLSLLCISSILWVFHLPWIFWDQYKWILWQESCNTLSLERSQKQWYCMWFWSIVDPKIFYCDDIEIEPPFLY